MKMVALFRVVISRNSASTSSRNDLPTLLPEESDRQGQIPCTGDGVDGVIPSRPETNSGCFLAGSWTSPTDPAG